MTENERKTAEFQDLLREEAQALPPLDRRQKALNSAICLATARANRAAYRAARVSGLGRIRAPETKS